MRACPINRQLYNIRQQKKLTVEELAERSGYSVSHIRHMECGSGLPSFKTLLNWAEALGYSIVLERKPQVEGGKRWRI